MFNLSTARCRAVLAEIPTPTELFVFETGHDVGPVVEFGSRVNFRITVVGFHGGLATDKWFPGADRVISTSLSRGKEELPFDDTAAVVMTHNFLRPHQPLDGRTPAEEVLN